MKAFGFTPALPHDAFAMPPDTSPLENPSAREDRAAPSLEVQMHQKAALLNQALRHRTTQLAHYEAAHPDALLELNLHLAEHAVWQEALAFQLDLAPDCSSLSGEAQRIHAERQACAQPLPTLDELIRQEIARRGGKTAA